MKQHNRPVHQPLCWIALVTCIIATGNQADTLNGTDTPSHTNTLSYTGTAHIPATLQPVYTEAYTEHFDRHGKLQRSSVQYRDMQGASVADKQLDYLPHPYAPAFRFNNRKTGYREAVSWRDDGRVKLMHHEVDAASPEEKILRVPEPVVADAGFNQFVRDHLPQLARGETIDFNFLNPARLDWFRFTASGHVQEHQRIEVTIAPASRVLQWLVEPIVLTYSSADGRLLEYAGLTNMSLDGRHTLSAYIQYVYQDSAAQPLSQRGNPLDYAHHPED
jgi:hypothetical protein